MPKTHELKCWPDSFAAIRRGEKPWETRYNDRDYQVGDILKLREFVPLPGAADITDHPAGAYSGAFIHRKVRIVRTGDAGLMSGYVILGLADDNTPVATSPLHQKAIELLQKGSKADEVTLQIIELVRAEDSKDKQPGEGTELPLRYAAMEPRKHQPHPNTAKDHAPYCVAAPHECDGTCGGKEPIPSDVYWSEMTQNFYSQITGRGQGDEFFARWRDRCAEFPTTNSVPTLRNVPDYEREDLMREVGEAATKRLDQKDPRRPVTAHERELLQVLQEECAEVIKQISKLLRFGRVGIDQTGGGQKNYDNIALLGVECGHVQHMINVIQACELVWPSSVSAGEKEKAAKLLRYLQTSRNPVDENFREVE